LQAAAAVVVQELLLQTAVLEKAAVAVVRFQLDGLPFQQLAQ
jgi:hypothetical protein